MHPGETQHAHPMFPAGKVAGHLTVVVQERLSMTDGLCRNHVVDRRSRVSVNTPSVARLSSSNH